MLHGTFTETYTHHVTRPSQFTRLVRMPRRASRETQKMTLKAHVKLVHLKRSRNPHNFWAREKKLCLLTFLPNVAFVMIIIGKRRSCK